MAPRIAPRSARRAAQPAHAVVSCSARPRSAPARSPASSATISAAWLSASVAGWCRAAEEFHPLGEDGAQCQPAAVDAGLDGAERDPGHRRDLGVVVALDVVQDDGRPLVGRDRAQRRREGAPALGRGRDGFRIGLGARRRLPRIVLELRVRRHGTALASPLEVHGRVHRDPREPAAERGAAVGAQVPVGGEERLLDGVGRLVGIGDQAGHQRVAEVLVGLHELVERRKVAVEGAGHQDLVAARDRLVARADGGWGGGGALARRGRARIVQRGSAPSGADARERRGGEAARV